MRFLAAKPRRLPHGHATYPGGAIAVSFLRCNDKLGNLNTRGKVTLSQASVARFGCLDVWRSSGHLENCWEKQVTADRHGRRSTQTQDFPKWGMKNETRTLGQLENSCPQREAKVTSSPSCLQCGCNEKG